MPLAAEPQVAADVLPTLSLLAAAMGAQLMPPSLLPAAEPLEPSAGGPTAFLAGVAAVAHCLAPVKEPLATAGFASASPFSPTVVAAGDSPATAAVAAAAPSAPAAACA